MFVFLSEGAGDSVADQRGNNIPQQKGQCKTGGEGAADEKNSRLYSSPQLYHLNIKTI